MISTSHVMSMLRTSYSSTKSVFVFIEECWLKPIHFVLIKLPQYITQHIIYKFLTHFRLNIYFTEYIHEHEHMLYSFHNYTIGYNIDSFYDMNMWILDYDILAAP